MENSSSCYCDQRESNPEIYKEIPENFCGICEICGKPGHTRAHPFAPITSSWCDSCFEKLPQINRLNRLIYLSFFIILALIIYWFNK